MGSNWHSFLSIEADKVYGDAWFDTLEECKVWSEETVKQYRPQAQFSWRPLDYGGCKGEQSFVDGVFVRCWERGFQRSNFRNSAVKP